MDCGGSSATNDGTINSRSGNGRTGNGVTIARQHVENESGQLFGTHGRSEKAGRISHSLKRPLQGVVYLEGVLRSGTYERNLLSRAGRYISTVVEGVLVTRLETVPNNVRIIPDLHIPPHGSEAVAPWDLTKE